MDDSNSFNLATSYFAMSAAPIGYSGSEAEQLNKNWRQYAHGDRPEDGEARAILTSDAVRLQNSNSTVGMHLDPELEIATIVHRNALGEYREPLTSIIARVSDRIYPTRWAFALTLSQQDKDKLGELQVAFRRALTKEQWASVVARDSGGM